MILMLITTVWLGAIGFLDDYIKVFKKDKEGLHGRFKIVGQVGLGLIVGLTLFLSPDVVIRENVAVQTPGFFHIAYDFCGDSRFERSELDRRSRRFSDGNFGHHGFDIGHIGLSVGAYSVRIVFEYHVYTGERGTGCFRQRFYGGDNRFFVV